MQRIVIFSISSIAMVCLGCGVRSYERRMDHTLANMKYRQLLDANLNPAIEGNFKEQGIFLRIPKEISKAQTFALTTNEGQFDLAEAFYGTPPAAGGAQSQGQGQGRQGGGAQAEPSAAPMLRMHMVARIKKKATPAKKGAPPTPAPAVNQIAFPDAVRNLLAQDFGQEALSAAVKKNTTKRANSYDLISFTGSNGNEIRAYLLKQNEFDVALIWDIPPQLKSLTVRKDNSVDLTLESFAVGLRARKLFESGMEEETTGGGIEGPTAL